LAECAKSSMFAEMPLDNRTVVNSRPLWLFRRLPAKRLNVSS
jgi:hypothetical protein